MPHRPRLAYVMSRFPHLPETFILREMSEMERQGWQIELYPLINQREDIVHAETRPWLSRAHHSPFLSWQVVKANLRTFLRQPGRYLQTWAQVLWGNHGDLNFLLRGLALFPKAVGMAAQMRAEGVQHIHAHYATHPALVAWIIHRLTGIPYSVTVHAHDIFVRTAMIAPKLEGAEFIVAISEYNRQHICRLVGAHLYGKTHIVHCGIRPQFFSPRPADAGRSGTFEILSIGSLEPYKGQKHLVEACAILRQRGVPLRCRIIGKGEERPDLERRIAQHNLAGTVELLGGLPQEEVARLLPLADCYVQPSIITPSGKMEGIPVALMEALACAVPCVATSISGIPELVQPGKTGYLVPPADPAALADALQAVYSNPQNAARTAQAGRQLVLDQFELSANVQQLSQIFESASAAKAPGLQLASAITA